MPISDRYHTVTTRARLLAMAPLTCLLLCQQPLAAEPSSLARAELQRRAANAQEAQELLKKGDEAYEAGKWDDAVKAYTGARALLPDAPATAALRDAATERLVQASVEQARKQKRLGDVKGAGETIGRVLAEDVAPDSGAALGMQEEINDPIRTNPAATLEHGQNVEEVRLLLYRAEGFKNLGDFDKAGMIYEDVLRVDPTNKAARRGMEQVTQLKTDYLRAAYDHARADMLAEVDESWQLRVTPNTDVEAMLDTARQLNTGGDILLSEKMDRIMLPIVSFEGVKIQEAFDFLRQQSIERDTLELDPARKGVNFVLDFGSDQEVASRILDTEINLQLRNVPMSQVVKYITEVTRTSYSAQEWAVVIRPAGVVTTDLVTRTFTVPPDFLSAGGSAAGGGGELDPFSDQEASEGLLAKRLGAEDVLKGFGVPFPEGATANFNAVNSTLRVVNTVENLAMVQQAVDQLMSAEPKMVSVQVRLIKIQGRQIEELGFDWMLDDFGLGGSGLTPGVAAGHLSGGALNPENFADIPLAPGSIFRHAITSGNRSGTEAVTGDAIDARIQEQSMGFAPGASRAPGVVWANAILNNTNLTMMMRGLSQKTGVDVVVSPSTVTRSGQQSTVKILREFIYPTEYEPPELPNSVGSSVVVDFDTGEIGAGAAPLFPITPATPTSFDMKEVGVVLDVLPTVSADGNYVDLAVKPTLTDFDGFVNYGTPITSPAPSTLGDITGLGTDTRVELTPNEILMPVFSTTRLDTNITIADGATIAVGGLLQERVQKVEDSTKILGDIPVVGRLFKSEVYAPTRTAVLFLVTVNVLDPTGEKPRGN